MADDLVMEDLLSDEEPVTQHRGLGAGLLLVRKTAEEKGKEKVLVDKLV